MARKSSDISFFSKKNEQKHFTGESQQVVKEKSNTEVAISVRTESRNKGRKGKIAILKSTSSTCQSTKENCKEKAILSQKEVMEPKITPKKDKIRLIHDTNSPLTAAGLQTEATLRLGETVYTC